MSRTGAGRRLDREIVGLALPTLGTLARMTALVLRAGSGAWARTGAVVG